MAQALKDKIGASMGLKLVVIITGVIFVLMVLGTLFVARIMTADQYRHIETRGEVQASSDMIVKAIERIKQIAKENANQAAGLNIAVGIMADQTGVLKKEIEKFRT